MLFGLGLGLASGSGACFTASVDDCDQGSEDCACYGNGTCDAGLACMDGICMPGGDTETTGDGDPGDGDPTAGDGDPGDGDPTGDGDPGDGDPGPLDSDMDGIDDDLDNCPDLPNPKQLDFDGDERGNVCDPIVFTKVTGSLETTFEIGTAFAGCDLMGALPVVGGEVQVRLDDDALIATFQITRLELGDVPPQDCDFGVVGATFGLTDSTVLAVGPPFPVQMLHGQAQHDAGVVTGDSNIPHPAKLETTVVSSIDNGRAMMIALDVTGELPIFNADISDQGAAGRLEFAGDDLVFGTTIMINQPVPLGIDIDMVGLYGALSLGP